MDSSGCYCPSRLFIYYFFLDSTFIEKKKVFRVRIVLIDLF